MRDSWLFDATNAELFQGVDDKIKYFEEKTNRRGVDFLGSTVREYKEWRLLLSKQPPDSIYQLDKDDWVFFFGDME